MKMLKLPNTEPLRKQNVYGSFGFDWLCSAEHFLAFDPASPEATPRQVGFDWVRIGFVLHNRSLFIVRCSLL